MVNEIFNILLIEDNIGDVRLVQETLHAQKNPTINLFTASSLAAGKKLIVTETIDVILLDLNLPDSKGLETFQHLHKFALECPIIIMSVLSDKELVYQALKQGARAYLIKGKTDNEALVSAIRYCRWSYNPA